MATERDKNVLKMILNPWLPNQPLAFTPSCQQPEDKEGSEEANTAPGASLKLLPNYEECLQHELAGIKLAEEKKLDEALVELTAAVELCPSNPAPLNNRAQVLRLLHRDNDAMADLNKAIELCTGGCSDLEHISKQAYVQRAMLHQLRNEEEEARADYEKAAAHGSKLAKEQLVAINPYAALCASAYGEALSKLQEQGE